MRPRVAAGAEIAEQPASKLAESRFLSTPHSFPGSGAAAPVTSRKVLIVAEHASAKFGGEAALPLHYFRVMRKMGVDVRLITHDRVQAELQQTLGDDIARVHFIRDNAIHRLLWRVGRWMPTRVAYFTTGFASRSLTQVMQRRVARALIREHGIDIVHQPMPVSPREPSLMHGLGAPVVIGPLNGNMAYPPGFQKKHDGWQNRVEVVARAFSDFLNVIIPGKPKAAAILVANERTREALPSRLRSRAIVLVENGVDLAVWDRGQAAPTARTEDGTMHIVFMGRLIDLKAVDLLLLAFDQARQKAAISLAILGDGPSGAALRQQAEQMGMRAEAIRTPGKVFFAGWMSQRECSQQLRLSDVLVLPSLRECGGAVVLEAMACGLPVIATAWGGPLDYLDGSTGLLVEPTSREALVDGLTQAILKLAASPALRESLGVQARRRIETDFDWDRKVETVFSIYEKALGSPR
jgi:glycosyltransferase involved in cell wall biosynthesis